LGSSAKRKSLELDMSLCNEIAKLLLKLKVADNVARLGVFRRDLSAGRLNIERKASTLNPITFNIKPWSKEVVEIF
jgi:hypothetical protein